MQRDGLPEGVAARRSVRLRDRSRALAARRLARLRCSHWGVVAVARAAAAPRTEAAVHRGAVRPKGPARRRTRRAVHHRLGALRRATVSAGQAPPGQLPSLAERPASFLAQRVAGLCRAYSQSQVLQPLRDPRSETPHQPQKPREALHDDSTHFARQIDPQPNAMLSGRRSQPVESICAAILERCRPIRNCRPGVGAERSRRSVRWTVARQEVRYPRHPHSGRADLRTRCWSPRRLASAQERKPRSLRARTTRPASTKKVQ